MKTSHQKPGIVITSRSGSVRIDATTDLCDHPDFVAEYSCVKRFDGATVRFRGVRTIADLPSALSRMLTDLLQLPPRDGENDK